MARGIERRPIFKGKNDLSDFIARLGETLKKTDCGCYAWALMPNHFHLLIRAGKEGTSPLMQKLMTGYAMCYNHRHHRVGHLFSNRYKSIICEDEPYLLELVRYIHLNPLRAKLVRDMAELRMYKWSGHSVLMGEQKAAWQDTDKILNRFGDDVGIARRKYESYVAEGVGKGRNPNLIGGGLIRSMGGLENLLRNKGGKEASDFRILGEGDFVEAVLKESEETDKQSKVRFPDQTSPAFRSKSVHHSGANQSSVPEQTSPLFFRRDI